MKPKQYDYCMVLCEDFVSGAGILNPTAHDYEDLYADMYVKVVDFNKDKTGRVCTCKLHENSNQELYFRHKNKIYKLKDFEVICY